MLRESHENEIDGDDALTSTVENAAAEGVKRLRLTLDVDDPDIVSTLSLHAPGRDRDAYALAAMKIGVLALRQAEGQIDVERVRHEGDRLLNALTVALDRHREGVTGDIGRSLKEYFDPKDGRFSERVERLVSKDGDLENVLRAQVAGDGSALVKTLSDHMGPASPIMQAIDPTAEKGIARHLARAVEETAAQQREAILKQFSLDNPDGALTRTLRELSEQHGAAGEALEKKVEMVVSEFSLDKPDSALSNLVRRVDQAQRLISDEFSLDKDGSALFRMRKEMLDQIEGLAKNNREFQTDVMARLAEMAARKAESLRSTTHGLAFEEALISFLKSETQAQGDIAVATGATTGLIKHNKKGDCVIELGPDHVAAGAKIVVEAKESASYDLAKARQEIDEARKNRGAGVGLFVFSARTAPEGLDPLARYGEDVFVVWDEADQQSDFILKAGLSLTRALAAKSRVHDAREAADFNAIEMAIRAIEKQAGQAEQMIKLAQTVSNNGQKLEDGLGKVRKEVLKQILILEDGFKRIRDIGEG